MTKLSGSRLGLVVAAVLVVGAAGAFGASRLFAATPPVEYRTAPVARANVTQIVPISGSVSSSSDAQVSFKVNATVTAVLVAVGQAVQAGDVLAKVDDADQRFALQQAESNLSAAQARYDVILTGTDVANLRQQVEQAQQSLARLQTSYAAAKTNLDGFYAAGRADRDAATASFAAAQSSLTALRTHLRSAIQWAEVNASENSTDTILGVFQQAQVQTPILDRAFADLATAIADLGGQVALADLGRADPQRFAVAQVSFNAALARAQSGVDVFNGQLGSALGTANTIVVDLTATGPAGDKSLDKARADAILLVQQLATAQQQLISAKTRLGALSGPLGTIGDVILGSALESAGQSVTSAKQSLQTKLENRPSDIQSALASLQSAQASYESARTALANTALVAPIAGVVTQINGAVGDVATGTVNAPFLVLVNTSALALHGTIGEADVARLRLGQMAAVIVDAVGTEKRFTGKVTSIDPVATLQQGVPVYGVDVTLDVADPEIRAGMTSTANIIIASKRDVLVVPNLAIRNVSGRRAVQVMRDGTPVDVTTVAFGISNDQVTEVTSGLQEGDVVVLPTPRAAATPQTGGGQFRVPAGGAPPGR